MITAAINTASDIQDNVRKFFEAREIKARMQQNRLALKFAMDQQEAYRLQMRQLEGEFALLQNRLSSL